MLKPDKLIVENTRNCEVAEAVLIDPQFCLNMFLDEDSAVVVAISSSWSGSWEHSRLVTIKMQVLSRISQLRLISDSPYPVWWISASFWAETESGNDDTEHEDWSDTRYISGTQESEDNTEEAVEKLQTDQQSMRS